MVLTNAEVEARRVRVEFGGEGNEDAGGHRARIKDAKTRKDRKAKKRNQELDMAGG